MIVPARARFVSLRSLSDRSRTRTPIEQDSGSGVSSMSVRM